MKYKYILKFSLILIFICNTRIMSQVNQILFPKIKIPSTNTSVTIPVIAKTDLTNQDITSFTAEAEWDSTVIKEPLANHLGTLTEGWDESGYFQNTDDPGRLIFGQFVAQPPLEGSGALINLKFAVNGKAGDSTLLHFITFTLNGLDAATTDGTLKINQPPTAQILSLEPTTPKTADSLFGQYNFFDPDGDPEDATQIRWFKNNNHVLELNNQLSVPNSLTGKNDAWYFEVIPRDSMESGLSVKSNTIIIQNTPPTAEKLLVLPENPLTTDSLVADYDFNDMDNDEEMGSVLNWYQNNTLRDDLKNQRIITPDLTQDNDEWFFSVQPNDGSDFGEVYCSTKVTIGSTAVFAAFTADTTIGIDSLMVHFQDHSTGPIISWLWEFGDSTTSTERNPVHTFTRKQKRYTVKLSVTGPAGIHSIEKQDLITIYQQVKTSFTAFPIVGNAGVNVQFINSTSGDAGQFHFDYGDGANEFVENILAKPEHAYADEGTFPVTLSASGNGGSDTLKFKDLIYIDENYIQLNLLENSGSLADFGWEQAIDQDVFSGKGMVCTAKDSAWAVFSFADSSLRKITKIRFRKSFYYCQTVSDSQKQNIEVFVSKDGLEEDNFTSLFLTGLAENDWLLYEFQDSVAAKYIKLIMFNSPESSTDSCELAEFQIFGTRIEPAVRVNHQNQITGQPAAYNLLPNYPNPFNPQTNIEFWVPRNSEINLSIFNLNGRLIRNLIRKNYAPGRYHVIWDGRNESGDLVASGVYFYRLSGKSENQQQFHLTQKLIFMK